MTKQDLPTIEYLHKRLRYDPKTGKLFWRDYEDMPNNWRARLAGKEAFTTNNNKGYLEGRIDGVRFRAHRVIWAMQHGEWPSDQIDHINGTKADNRIVNLRDVSCAENQRNRAMRNDNTSGVTGVYWNKAAQKWLARINIDGRRKHLGLFDTIDEAAAVRAEASSQHGYTERHGSAE